MKTKILLFLLLCLTSLSMMGQTSNTQGTISRKKCASCGMVLSKCPYKGKHPAKPQPEKTCSTCGKVISKCQYKGKHPEPKPQPEKTCSSCGKVLSKCQYKGKHPEPKPQPEKTCSSCGKVISKCQYKGKHPEPVRPTRQASGTINGHEWVDLGLSVKWATCNVGASSPSDYGGYYAWGETRTKSSYDWSNCFDCLDGTGDSWGTYKLGGQTRITPSSGHDTARENWGGTWRMPTDAENEELCKKCKWTWTSMNGHKGYTVTGPNGNSIFLPAAGWRNGTSPGNVGECGYYWSSTLSSSYSSYARYLYFYSSGHNTYYSNRSYGRSVRPVTE